MSVYLLLALSLCAAAFGLYWLAKRAGISPAHSGTFAGAAVVAFLLGWAFRGGAAQEPVAVTAPSPPVVTPNPAMFHDALSALHFPSRVAAAKAANGTVEVKNTSPLPWQTRNGPILLGFHLLATDGRTISEGRALLGRDVKPGEKRIIRFAAMMPDAPGQYTLKVDVVYEGYAWFESSRNRPETASLTVI